MSIPTQIPYGRHLVDDDDVAAVVEALRSPWLTQGPQTEAFEQELGQYVAAPHVSVCANGTAALHLAYAALGLGAGDEIITTPVTFSATASAAHSLGARVIFGDVCPETGTLDPNSVDALVNHRTQGVVAVHLGGHPADMAALRRVCERHGLWLVEDASHALGARYRGAPVGCCRYADATTFSFHPVKHLATGEGGAVATTSDELKRRIDRLRHHGIERDDAGLKHSRPGPWYYEVQELGYNYRLSELQCALGRSQLRKQEPWLERRRAIAARYHRSFDGLVTYQPERAGVYHAYHLLISYIDFERYGVSRAEVMQGLLRRGIGTQVHYIPLPHHPYYRELYGEVPDARGVAAYYEQTLSLPMYSALSDAEVDYVTASLAEILHCRRRMAAGGSR